MRTIIKKTQIKGMEVGWGNGYVIIPPGHALHGKDYEDIDVDIHCGLTFSELVTQRLLELWPELTSEDLGYWVVGFDTAHYGDNLQTWPKEAVQAEADRLLVQLTNFL